MKPIACGRFLALNSKIKSIFLKKYFYTLFCVTLALWVLKSGVKLFFGKIDLIFEHFAPDVLQFLAVNIQWRCFEIISRVLKSDTWLLNWKCLLLGNELWVTRNIKRIWLRLGSLLHCQYSLQELAVGRSVKSLSLAFIWVNSGENRLAGCQMGLLLGMNSARHPVL